MPKYNIIDVNTSAGIDSKNKKKLIKIYKKWKNIYEIFNKYNFNYKIIKENLNEIYNYINDKNI